MLMNTYIKPFISLLSLLLFVGNVFADSTPPLITLNKGRYQQVQLGSVFVSNEPKSVSDNQTDSAEIVVRKKINTGSLNTLKRGLVYLYIEAEDTSKNIAYDTVIYNVDDFIPPSIDLNTPDQICTELGKPYNRVQATASDNFYTNNNLSLVLKSSDVNTNVIGFYTDEYEATDASGNKTRKIRIVQVKVGCNTSNVNYASLPLNVSIYPNPSNTCLNINSNYILNDAVISIIDINGRVINEIPFSATTDVSIIPNGIYCLKITSNSINYQTYIEINHN